MTGVTGRGGAKYSLDGLGKKVKYLGWEANELFRTISEFILGVTWNPKGTP
jgi:hypothetical protein